MNDILHYATLPYFLQGMIIALKIAGASFVLSLALGLALALGRSSPLPPVRWLVGFYLWIIRGTPIILQLIFWYNALPEMGLNFSGVLTAIWGLSIAYAAFVCELLRGGLMAVKQGQLDAGMALGMSPLTVFVRVRAPQALRVVIPSLCTVAIYLVKDTALASVIAVDELTLRSEQEVSRTFNFVGIFGGAAIIYLVVTSVIVLIQRYLETKLDYTRRPAPVRRPLDEAGQASPSDAMRALDRHISHDPGKRDELVVSGHGMKKQFGDHVVLNGVDLDVRRGEVVCLIGPSGSGKTTLLRCLNNLEPLNAGIVVINGVQMGAKTDSAGRVHQISGERHRAAARARARVGMVFQQFNLFEHLSVNQNIALAPTATYGKSRDEIRREAVHLLAAVGLAEYGEYLPHRLSGGQQQRIAICRALATDPTVMLFDEPTSALDPEKVGEVLTVMRDLAALGMTMVVATHEMSFARRCANRVVFMDGGQVVESGPPDEVLLRPREPRTQKFLASVLGDTLAQPDASGLAAAAIDPAE